MEAVNSIHTANIFVVATALQYICAEKIVERFENAPNKKNFLFLIKPGLVGFVEHDKWELVEENLPPRYCGEKGFWGKYKIVENNLDKVLGCCDDNFNNIVLHAAQISSLEETNFLINGIRKDFPKSKFCVRILPDGIQNICRYKKNILNQYKKLYKKFIKLFFPKLNYYPIFGDKIGTDSKIVELIYILPNFPHEYESSRVRVVPLLGDVSNSSRGSSGKALVIGQPLQSLGLVGEEGKSLIERSIASIVSAYSIDNILYKKHPKEEPCDRVFQNCKLLDIEIPLEKYFLENHFDLIVGVCSTALYTARTMFNDKTRVVSVGLNKLIFKESFKDKKIYDLYRSLNIDIYDA